MDDYMSLLARLPDSGDAEYALAGLCLWGAKEALDVAQTLDPGDFANPHALAVVKACILLARDGITPDPILVKDRLSNNPDGIKAAVRSIMDALAMSLGSIPAHAPHYAKIIHDTAQRRHAALEGIKLLQANLDPEATHAHT